MATGPGAEPQAPGATVTVTTYARRYGADRYTACEDLTALGFPLPDSAHRWGAPAASPAAPPAFRCPAGPLDDEWIMIDGRPYFIAGYTSGGAPYGLHLDEMDDDYLTGTVTPGRPGKLSDP